jgi:ribA/ribD-fused uncharacterized protein
MASAQLSPGRCVFFYSNHFLSNFWNCKILYAFKSGEEPVEVENAETAIMYAKARVMGDEESAEAIRGARSPAEAKRLGRKVKYYNDAVWAACREQVARDVLEAKFRQNEGLRAKLLATGDKMLVEASASDRIWGIGLSVRDAKAGKQWRGRNILGRALVAVRVALGGQAARLGLKRSAFALGAEQYCQRRCIASILACGRRLRNMGACVMYKYSSELADGHNTCRYARVTTNL